MSIYLDNAATTRVCPEAAEAAIKVMTENYANPSSTHRMGREAKKLLDDARAKVAKALGCTAEEVYFTSCGSEGDNWAIIQGARYAGRKGKHIISSGMEHSAVKKSLELLEKEGFEVTLLEPEADGSISKESVLAALRPETCLITLMLVNNEVGAITDIAGIAKAVKSKNPRTLIHTDAVQAFLKVPFNATKLGVDMIAISGHKVHAPKGIGALYIRKGLSLPPHIIGAGQEGGKRAGTEAMPQIVAFGEACESARIAFPTYHANLKAMRAHAIERITSEIDSAVIIGGDAPQLLSVSLPGHRSEVIMNFLEAREIYVSKGSACKKGHRSAVLEAMKLPADVMDGAIRVSFCRYTTMEEIDAFCDALRDAHQSLRAAVK
ncbi:MAG: cysteine desulfurase [Oscillospiraceae bacterium]|nr:cysteine desulfurase [Oscillospiraceae bacterium]